MKFQLITLSGVKYSGDAYAVVLPSMAGELAVLDHHEPLMSALKTGIITIRKTATDPDYHWENYATYGGVVEVSHAGVRVLVDEADHGDQINQQEAERARLDADRMLNEAKTQIDIDHAQALVDRQAVRLQVSELRRRSASRRV
jgi:F-type H+-transporting ATPase subunit epsilon